MYHNVSPLAKQKISDLAKEGLVLADEQMEFMLEVIRNMQNREFTEVAGKQIPIPKTLGYHNQGVMATSRYMAHPVKEISTRRDSEEGCNFKRVKTMAYKIKLGYVLLNGCT